MRQIEEESDGPESTIEELVAVPLKVEEPAKVILIGALLPEEQKNEMLGFLKQNEDVFAWSHDDMPGIDPAHSCHWLNIDPHFPSARQKPRRFAPEKNRAINKEVEKLLESSLIRECVYPRWVSNPVVVKKKNGDDCICIDFTNLNKARPKDSFPLPRIDQMVDTTAGFNRMSFLDAYSGQIPLYAEDQIHTAFITERGLYYYRCMPFGLKNIGQLTKGS
ncbi:hypothetical protein PanWU01x14_030570 [Parasponia andersonii]|uniref:Reverse transcriptase domain-containing protein n=1 Tax=Parasponia andersonii TaxID=3476 RepID=A0A2P5DUT2_PARAD|nr:hypothetical protein PanWU01x14_030570 [Parasponia andersonii]